MPVTYSMPNREYSCAYITIYNYWGHLLPAGNWAMDILPINRYPFIKSYNLFNISIYGYSQLGEDIEETSLDDLLWVS